LVSYPDRFSALCCNAEDGGTVRRHDVEADMTKIDATKTFITYGLAFGLIALTAVAGAL
jgi:hypothetical protein